MNDDLAGRFVREARLACLTAGLTQREWAARARISPSRLSRVLRSEVCPDLALAAQLVRSTGHELTLRILPADGVRLRDAGQLGIAELIVAEAHASWRRRLELPVGNPPDRRAADLVLDHASAALHIEIERWLRDLQAQVRAAQLKRAALTQLLGRPVSLIFAVRDTPSNRTAVAPFRRLLAEAFPFGSRAAWAAIRSGEGLEGDAVLWVRNR